MTKLTDRVTDETRRAVTNYRVSERVMQERFRELCQRRDGITEICKQYLDLSYKEL